MGQAPILIHQNRESSIIMNNYRDISIRDDEFSVINLQFSNNKNRYGAEELYFEALKIH